MAHSIKTVYVVHHSHTDIGYTDLQERVIAIQVNYIKTVLSMMRQPEYADFRWNCETLYCVEEFWKQASEDDRADFARFVKEGKIGISANYLNFNDLVNADVFGKRLANGRTSCNRSAQKFTQPWQPMSMDSPWATVTP